MKAIKDCVFTKVIHQIGVKYKKESESLVLNNWIG